MNETHYKRRKISSGDWVRTDELRGLGCVRSEIVPTQSRVPRRYGFYPLLPIMTVCRGVSGARVYYYRYRSHKCRPRVLFTKGLSDCWSDYNFFFFFNTAFSLFLSSVRIVSFGFVLEPVNSDKWHQKNQSLHDHKNRRTEEISFV